VHLLKLKKLKNIILNGPTMTAAWHGNLSVLPLESLSVSQGNALPATEAIAGAKAIPTLRRFAMTGKTLTDADLTTLPSASQIESLSLEDIDLPDARVGGIATRWPFDNGGAAACVVFSRGLRQAACLASPVPRTIRSSRSVC
jgi:hypothetical protein